MGRRNPKRCLSRAVPDSSLVERCGEIDNDQFEIKPEQTRKKRKKKNSFKLTRSLPLSSFYWHTVDTTSGYSTRHGSRKGLVAIIQGKITTTTTSYQLVDWQLLAWQNLKRFIVGGRIEPSEYSNFWFHFGANAREQDK